MKTTIGLAAVVIGFVATAPRLSAQAVVSPTRVRPAEWVTFELAVVNLNQTAVMGVAVVVPEVATVLGVERLASWEAYSEHATDSSLQRIEWSGGTLQPGQMQRFTFMARIAGDARGRQLFFPVSLAGEQDTTHLDPRAGGLVVQIVGSTRLTPLGAAGIAGIAIAVALVALGVAVSARSESG